MDALAAASGLGLGWIPGLRNGRLLRDCPKLGESGKVRKVHDSLGNIHLCAPSRCRPRLNRAKFGPANRSGLKIRVRSETNGKETDRNASSEEPSDNREIASDEIASSEEQEKDKSQFKLTEGSRPSSVRSGGAKSWSSEEVWSAKDKFGGWSLPIQLDETKTDVPFLSGLPEVTAGLALALAIAVFGFTAFHKRGMNLVQLRPVDVPVSSRTFEPLGVEAPEARKSRQVGTDVTDSKQTQQDVVEQADSQGMQEVPSTWGEAGNEHAEAKSEAGNEAGAINAIEAKSAEEREIGAMDVKASQSEEPGAEYSGSQPPVQGNIEEAQESPASVGEPEGTAGQLLFNDEGRGADDGAMDDSNDVEQQPRSTFQPEEEELDFSSFVPWAQAMGGQEEVPEDVVPLQDLAAEIPIHTAASGQAAFVSSPGPNPPAPVSSVGKQTSRDQKPGRVVVPAVVDAAQAQALEALQALKVIEEDVNPAGICTRREYARWILAASNLLSRNAGDRIFPSMYVEGLTELAFEDVLPDDPDFPAIQGLAEAGLISSKLSRSDLGCERGIAKPGCTEGSGTEFRPDSALTRQDLISWKVALEHRQLAMPSAHEVKKASGYLDVDRIDADALPAIAYDLSAGEQSIITAAFGYTRRFEPYKPVTRAQAACTLALGEAAELVGEELTRIEAERIAEAAVVAAVEAEAAEARAERETFDAANQELALERQKRAEAERATQVARQELEQAWRARQQDLDTIQRTKAAAETERGLLQRIRQQAEEQIAALASNRERVEVERQRLESLRSRAEAEREAASQVKSELDVERRALGMARSWAEEQATAAQSEARRLEAARRGFEQEKAAAASVLKKLTMEEVLPLPKWPEVPIEEGKAEVAEMPKETAPASKDWKEQFRPKELLSNGEEWRNGGKAALKMTVESLEESAQAALKRLEGKRQHAWEETVKIAGSMKEEAATKLEEVAAGTKVKAGEAAGVVSDSAKKLVDGFKERARKFTQQFKAS